MKKLRVLIVTALAMTCLFSMTAFAAFGYFGDGQANATLTCERAGQLKRHRAQTRTFNSGYQVQHTVDATYYDGSVHNYYGVRSYDSTSSESNYDWYEDFRSYNHLIGYGGTKIDNLTLSDD